jgi:diketogulonate reductase-like aldo/keto reductase
MLADGTRDILRDRSHIDTYLEMERLLKTGKVKAIGVANYSVKYLEDLLQRASIMPAINQIENHPQCPQQDIVDYCRQKGIHVTAYSPLGSSGSPLMEFPAVVEVADKHGVPPACVLLSYHG